MQISKRLTRVGSHWLMTKTMMAHKLEARTTTPQVSYTRQRPKYADISFKMQGQPASLVSNIGRTSDFCFCRDHQSRGPLQFAPCYWVLLQSMPFARPRCPHDAILPHHSSFRSHDILSPKLNDRQMHLAYQDTSFCIRYNIFWQIGRRWQELECSPHLQDPTELYRQLPTLPHWSSCRLGHHW